MASRSPTKTDAPDHKNRARRHADEAPASLHLIDEATCRDAPPRAAWLADLLAELADAQLVVVAHADAPHARRLGLEAGAFVRRRWPWLVPPTGSTLRQLRGVAEWGRVYDWSLDGSLARLAERLADGSARSPDELPVKFDDRRLNAADRDELRTTWGVDPETRIAWLASDSVGAVDVMLGVAATGLAAEAGRPWALVVHPGMPGVDRARRLVEAMGRSERLILDDRGLEPWSIAEGCEATIVCHSQARLAVRWAELAGVQVVATPDAGLTPPIRDGLLEPPPSAVAVESQAARARSIAERLCRISEGELDDEGDHPASGSPSSIPLSIRLTGTA